MATVTLKDIRKSYGDVEIIKGVNLSIEDREFCVFVGPSGCGKSTLLRMIAGLEEITAGDLAIDGQRANDVPPSERGLAMVFQTYALYPHMSVADNMGFSLRLAGASKAERKAKVGEAARILHLEKLLDRKPKELSGGQRQRVAIGRAIVRKPKVFLFDEPLSNLDAALRVQMRIELARLHDELAATMIYVTHDQVEAMTMADKIVVLRAGRIEQVGAPLDLYNRPANRFVAGFIGSPRMNFLEGRISRADRTGVTVEIPGVPPVTVAADGGASSAGEPVVLGVRPADVGVVLDGGDGPEAVVRTAEQLGSESYLYCELPRGQGLTIHHPGQTRIQRQDKVTIALDPAACHLFRAGEGEHALPRLS